MKINLEIELEKVEGPRLDADDQDTMEMEFIQDIEAMDVWFGDTNYRVKSVRSQ